MTRHWKTLVACTALSVALLGCGDDVAGTEEPSPPDTPRPAQEGDYRSDPGVEFFDVTHADGQTYRCIYIYAEHTDEWQPERNTGGPALWCEQRPPQ